MNEHARRLTMFAAGYLQEAVLRIRRLFPDADGPRGGRAAEQVVNDVLIPHRPQPRGVTHRMMVAEGFGAIERMLLARLKCDDATGTGVRVIRSTDTAVSGAYDAPPAARPVRSTPLELPFMVITPDKVVLGAERAVPAPPRLLVVGDQKALAELRACYDLLWWAMSDDIRAEETHDPLPPDLLELLKELATGATDATAARNLHLSGRTLSRRARELLDSLDATSRFQAGIVAARRGLV
ncbi:hypothetical protein [Phytomonospora endophytica]|uniref:HTH luxR-type domain-containing protein n=1 Tax=Phytomonospora endophytica TaxID=714109 RepID=A0A841FS31_9ACTN|nr:hypothetical protein [Phytomonospora endophytica]MBB6038856.1 hypothetical protein [Phytomonospora endophytica]GIG68349.1 hypothetical protein Pen01_46440 [Phytomonospora endophytica]